MNLEEQFENQATKYMNTDGYALLYDETCTVGSKMRQAYLAGAKAQGGLTVEQQKKLAERIVRDHQPHRMDYACGECVPNGDGIKDGYLCAYHTSIDLIAKLKALPSEQEEQK